MRVWDRTIDGKLTQLAAFSGVSISISGAIGGSVLAAQHLPAAFLIALGACLGLAALWLLAGVILAFRALAPKLYEGTDEREVIARTTPNTLRSDPATVIATFAGTHRDVLVAARKINDQKASATTRPGPATNRPSRVRSIHRLVCCPCAVGFRAITPGRPTASTGMPLNPCPRAISRS
jgi:hypothetical protein